jgi:inner membrane protease subunit SOM1
MSEGKTADKSGLAPIPTFQITSTSLEEAINTLPNGKQRKQPISLKDCELTRLLQYDCQITPKSRQVVCKPLARYFRRCEGGISVETTEWEEIRRVEKGREGER